MCLTVTGIENAGRMDYFRDPHDIALRISLDGIGLVNTPRQSQTVTPVVIYNLNLHPTDRNEASNALTVLTIPGSPKSEFIDTWLHPLMQELRLLQLGIHGVYDGYTKRPFMLRAHPILVTGDGKAIAQIMGTKSPGGAQKGCRMCELVGVQDNNSTFYYPSGGNLNPEPYNHQRDVIEAVHARQSSITLVAVAKMKKLTGISRRSTLLDVPTIHFPRSFPLDTMHCMSQNIPKLLMRMWRGLLFPNRNMPWVLTEGQWQAVNYSLAQSRSLIPTHVGTAPQNTATCMNWTSSEYHTFLTIYGAPALKANLPQLYGINLMRYRHILRLADKKTFTEAEIQDFRSRVGVFVQEYERIYFGNIAQQLRVCTIQIHYLLHLADNIRDFGSPVNFSQWALERFLRDIKHLARSPSLKYTSITINLLDLERRRHANFATSLPITTSYKHTQTGQPPLLLDRTQDKRPSRWARKLAQAQLAHPHGQDMSAPEDMILYRQCLLPSGATVSPQCYDRKGNHPRNRSFVAYTPERTRGIRRTPTFRSYRKVDFHRFFIQPLPTCLGKPVSQRPFPAAGVVAGALASFVFQLFAELKALQMACALLRFTRSVQGKHPPNRDQKAAPLLLNLT